MKKIIPCLFLLLIPFLSNAQITGKLRKVVVVLPQQNIFLAGAAKAGSNPVSRVNHTIDLPPNTIEWYYIFSVVGGQTATSAALDLVPQLEKNLDAGIDITSIAAPAGTHPGTVYLMNKTNAEAFLQKVDNAGGSFSYIPSGTKEHVKEGVVQIKDAVYGTYWLGFKNPGAEDITVRVQAAAITEEMVLNNRDWSGESKQNLYTTFYENIKGKLMDETDAKDIASCMIGQLSSTTTPGDYYPMLQAGKDSLLAALYRGCAAKYEEPHGPYFEKASNYGNLAWKQFAKGNIDSSIIYNDMALALDSSLPMVKANLGLCYLVKNDIATATNYYLQALADTRQLKLRYRKKEYLSSVIKNLDDAIQKYPGLKGAAEMKALYEEELRKVNGE